VAKTGKNLMSSESPTRIEPCHIEALPRALSDALVELVPAATQLGARLHHRTAASLAELVAVMNCYYSNLIEGHNTRPRDIERALANDLDEGRRRDLQLEARAHVRVQREIEAAFASGNLGEPTSIAFLRKIHRSFYEGAPAAMLVIEGPGGRTFTMTPGEFRTGPHQDVQVGRHLPPSSEEVPRFMQHFESRYRSLGRTDLILSMATAHHRLNYIHPFPDGNGRVSRLMSHAIALQAGIGAFGLWSISRGLARGLASRTEYKDMMDLADSPRRSDTDGRGNLSATALIEFATWFFRVAADQVAFMSDLFGFDRLRVRLQSYVQDTLELGDASALLVDDVFLRGHVARGEASRITKRPERTARDILRRLVEAGLLASDSPKGDVYLRFSSASADVLFPRLFPAEA
jgi:Fic family protein